MMAYISLYRQRIQLSVCILCSNKNLATLRYCRPCADKKNAAVKRWEQRNYECRNKRGILWKKRNPEKVKAITKRFYQRNRERILQKCRDYYYRNRSLQEVKHSTPSHTITLEKLSEFYPYQFQHIEGSDLIIAINNLVSKQLNEAIRADVCQEIALLICSGKIERSEIAEVVPSVIKEQQKLLPSKFLISIDGLTDWQYDRLETQIRDPYQQKVRLPNG